VGVDHIGGLRIPGLVAVVHQAEVLAGLGDGRSRLGDGLAGVVDRRVGVMDFVGDPVNDLFSLSGRAPDRGLGRVQLTAAL
jgi:hypothetical protein